MLSYTFYSRKYKDYITFSRPGKWWIFIDFDGSKPGSSGYQICKGGSLALTTFFYHR